MRVGVSQMWLCCVVQELTDFVLVEPQDHNSSVNGASILRRSADFSKMLLEYDFAAHGSGGAVRYVMLGSFSCSSSA